MQALQKHSSTKKGLTAKGKQRWYCKKCARSWSSNRKKYKNYRIDAMFNAWISGKSIRSIADECKLSKSYTYKLLTKRLNTDVSLCKDELKNCTHALFDGKFLFGRKRSALIIFDAKRKIPLAVKVAKSENREEIVSFLYHLKSLGFSPQAVTTDGKSGISSYFREVFPCILTQRCLFHIKLQVLSWVRIPPRCDLGWALKNLVDNLLFIESTKDALCFQNHFSTLKDAFGDEIAACHTMVKTDKYRSNKERDLLKCIRLIENALPEMFVYLKDRHIAKTSSALEGFNKKITRIIGFDHCGLSEESTVKFLNHFVSMTQKTSTK